VGVRRRRIIEVTDMDTAEREKLERDLVGLIADLAEVDPAEVRADRPLRDLGVDSLMVLELVAFIEKRTSTEIPEAEIGKVETLADILDKIRNGWQPGRG
jgi:acyl carrier protein